ncbi:hypothetical protein [Pseudomonas phage D6]|nr:hypothetical protein [Pseudomonas phage D6]
MKFKGIFSDDPKTAMSTKDIDRQTARLKYMAAAGSCVTVVLGMVIASLKLQSELKK